MFTIDIGIILKKYKCQWIDWNSKQFYVSKTLYIHEESLQKCINKATELYGRKPDKIARV